MFVPIKRKAQREKLGFNKGGVRDYESDRYSSPTGIIILKKP
jgi:hypothetical protein